MMKVFLSILYITFYIQTVACDGGTGCNIKEILYNSRCFLQRSFTDMEETIQDFQEENHIDVTEVCFSITVQNRSEFGKISIKACTKQGNILHEVYYNWTSTSCSNRVGNIPDKECSSNDNTNAAAKGTTLTHEEHQAMTTPYKGMQQDGTTDQVTSIAYTPVACSCPVSTSTSLVSSTTMLPSTVSTNQDLTSSLPATDTMQGNCKEAQGLGNILSAAIIGVTSFLAGMAVVLLFIWTLYLKRSSRLCFAKREKSPEKLTSDRVTKKVLAKHMLSATKDTTVTNAVYFKNETKDTETATGTNNKMQTSEGQGHMNTSKYGNKGNGTLGVNTNLDQNENGSQVYTTLQETETRQPNIGEHEQTDDEHVYRKLDLDHKIDISYPKGDRNNMKGKGQLGIPGKTDSDVFDHTRESAVSNQDYFVLQNENFRSSHQPGTQVSQSELSNEGNQMEHPGDTENTYFKLEKQ